MRVKSQPFVDDAVEMDGNSFEDCTFKNCRMIFRARGPVHFNRCTFDNVFWFFEDAAGLTIAFLGAIAGAGDDYGRSLIVNTFPFLKPWIAPQFIEKIAATEKINE